MRLKSKSAVICTRARPGPTTEETIVLDLLAQPLLVGHLALVGAGALAAVSLCRGAVGEQLAGLVDDRDALRLQAVDRGWRRGGGWRAPVAARACRAP